VATRRGERAEVYLSDGTRVTLGAASRLRFSAPLRKTSRDVYLEGEAVFEVTHNPKWPFVVRAAHAVTEDLGTRFSMRAYPTDSVVTVAVAEGKVALRGDRESGAVLGQGDVGMLTRGGRLETQHGVPLEPYLAWADGRLVFTNTPLSDVLPQLARWRDLDVRTHGLSADTLFLTATFTTESTDELLRYIALTLDVRQERRGRTVTFHAK
jgi:ferric-dicitrate binding protein FerR (iron transport regulator)